MLGPLIVDERTEQHHARVVDQHVGAAELVLHALGGSDERVAVGDVGLDRDGTVAELLSERLDAVGTARQQRDAVTGAGQGAGAGRADARRGAGDHGYAAVVRIGAHVVLLARSGWAHTHCAPDRVPLRGPRRGGPAGPLWRRTEVYGGLVTPRRDSAPRGCHATTNRAVNAATDIAEFLASRRAKISPEQSGLPCYGQRRVPGLRREEVASLAGVSADSYRRLERGQVSGVSELVLEGARASAPTR